MQKNAKKMCMKSIKTAINNDNHRHYIMIMIVCNKLIKNLLIAAKHKV